MGESFLPLNPGTGGRNLRVRNRTIAATSVDEQYVIPTTEEVVTYDGNVGTFRTPGRAGTGGQKLFAIHNATGSSVLVKVLSLNVSYFDTVAKLVAPPLVRAWRFTAIPTNGTALTKRGPDTAQSSNASVTVWGDASADGTGSGTTLTVTLPAAQFVSQYPAHRALTLVAESSPKEVGLLKFTGPQTLRALQGIAVFLDYTVATSNPTTDMWQVDCVWKEYTLP